MDNNIDPEIQKMFQVFSSDSYEEVRYHVPPPTEEQLKATPEYSVASQAGGGKTSLSSILTKLKGIKRDIQRLDTKDTVVQEKLLKELKNISDLLTE